MHVRHGWLEEELKIRRAGITNVPRVQITNSPLDIHRKSGQLGVLTLAGLGLGWGETYALLRMTQFLHGAVTFFRRLTKIFGFILKQPLMGPYQDFSELPHGHNFPRGDNFLVSENGPFFLSSKAMVQLLALARFRHNVPWNLRWW